MKTVFQSIIFGFLCSHNCFSQRTETIKVRSGEYLSNAISDSGIFRFTSFTLGMVVKNDSTSSSAKFNFNLVTGEMLFINNNGDTIIITNSNEINYIIIGNVFFYYRNGYKEVVADQDSFKLALDYNFKIGYETVGAYGQPVGAERVYTVPYVTIYLEPLSVAQNAIVTKTTTYYILNRNELPQIATKENFLKIFNSKEIAINEYIKAKHIKFNKLKDLESLFNFCATQ